MNIMTHFDVYKLIQNWYLKLQDKSDISNIFLDTRIIPYNMGRTKLLFTKPFNKNLLIEQYRWKYKLNVR